MLVILDVARRSGKKVVMSGANCHGNRNKRWIRLDDIVDLLMHRLLVSRGEFFVLSQLSTDCLQLRLRSIIRY